MFLLSTDKSVKFVPPISGTISKLSSLAISSTFSRFHQAFDVSLYDNGGIYTVANGKLTEKTISDTVREYTIKKEDIDDTLYFIGCLAK